MARVFYPRRPSPPLWAPGGGWDDPRPVGPLMKKRAELTARKFPFTPSENRDVAMGQISICYEMVDGAKSALDAANPDDKEAEARRIRKEVAAMQ